MEQILLPLISICYLIKIMIEHNEHLILKRLQGTLSAEEQKLLEKWTSESQDNHKLVNDLERLWKSGDIENTTPDFQSSTEWLKLEILLRKESEIPVRSLDTKINWLRIAASVSFLIIASYTLYFYFFKNNLTTIQTENFTSTTLLPDGSQVWLNAESRLTYSDDFNEKRSVTLSGEAFFDVKKNSEKPFEVHTAKALVKVLGTSFNVKAIVSDSVEEVLVVTGRVRFFGGGKNSAILTPGDAALMSKDGSIITRPGDANQVAWKNKRLIFKKTPLHEVLKTLRSYFNIDIQVKNEALLQCRFTSSFESPALQEVIEAVSVSLNLRVEKLGDVYFFDGNGCKEN